MHFNCIHPIHSTTTTINHQISRQRSARIFPHGLSFSETPREDVCPSNDHHCHLKLPKMITTMPLGRGRETRAGGRVMMEDRLHEITNVFKKNHKIYNIWIVREISLCRVQGFNSMRRGSPTRVDWCKTDMRISRYSHERSPVYNGIVEPTGTK